MSAETIDFPIPTRVQSDMAKNFDFGHSSYRKFSGVRGWRAISALNLFSYDIYIVAK
jgi:hypothetical protein